MKLSDPYNPCPCVLSPLSRFPTWIPPWMWFLPVNWMIWMLSVRLLWPFPHLDLWISPLFSYHLVPWLPLYLSWTLLSPNGCWLVGGPEWSASLAEGGEPWSSSATSAPGRRGAQGREPSLGRGSPSSTELQDPSRNRRAHPNWAILGNKWSVWVFKMCMTFLLE